MNLSTILEVAIGLTFTYLLLSVLCSGINEWIAQSTGRRGAFLREGLLNLLSDRWIYLRLVNHPLVAAYRRDSAGKAQNPSYLPPKVVAEALLAVIVVKANQLEGKTSEEQQPIDFNIVRDAAARCQKEGLVIGSALVPLLDRANNDLDTASKAVAAWYESSMDRVTGWYKRTARNSLLVIGTVLAVVLNVDSIEITRALMTSDTLRASVVEAASETAATAKIGDIQIMQDGKLKTLTGDEVKTLLGAGVKLETQGLPIGFACLASAFEAKENGKYAGISELVGKCLGAARDMSGGQRVFKIIGWLITALALTLGAPFWFDLLNRLVDLRGAGARPTPPAGQRK